jgi:hypothetical protein
MAPLAAAVSSTSERRAKRVLADRLILVFLMIKRSLDELLPDPAPQLTNFFRGSSFLRKLGYS